jgi:heme-degrading monooxygenase HmoA
VHLPSDLLPARSAGLVCRMWRGWALNVNAAAYRSYLEEELFPKMVSELGPRGYRGHQLITQTVGDQTEFVALTWFESLDSVRSFAGDDITRANVSGKARSLLARWDEHATHFELSSEQLFGPQLVHLPEQRG